jgi:predicted dehydrogenase
MKTAVLGLGFMGSIHVRAMLAAPGAELTAVYSADPAKLTGDLTGIQGNLGGPGQRFDFSHVKPYGSIPDLLADAEIEAVDLCLPTWLHEEVAVAALRAGKHVLVEKPMALDGDSARRIIAAADQAGRVLMCAHVLRFFPEYLALRDVMGDLGAVRAAFFGRRCGEPGWGGWLKDPAKSGGGAFDLLIHDIDTCLWLFGAPAAVSATGCADWVAGQLFYEGFTVGIEGGWQASRAYPFCMEYRVTFDRGIVEYSSAARPPVAFTDAERVLPLAAMDGYAAEIAYFVECCTAGKPPERCPPAQSAQAVELMQLVLDARARKGEKIACGNRG